MGRDSVSMVAFLFPVLIGTVFGLLAGLGVGGGSLLLLWLTQVIMMDQVQAKLLNLLFYLPAALVTTIFRAKQKTIQTDITLPALIGGCIAATAFSALASNINIVFAKKLLGGLLILIGIREVFYRPRNAR